MNWIDPSGFEPAPDVGTSADAAIYSWGCGDCSRISSDPGYDPLGPTNASGNLTTSPDIAGVDAFPSTDFAGTPTMPPGVGSWSPGSAQTGDVVPSAGTAHGSMGDNSAPYERINSSIEAWQLSSPPGPDQQSVQLAAGPAVVVAGGLAACLASAPCRIGLVFAGIVVYDGLKKATEAIVLARKSDIKDIDRIAKEFDLTREQRRILHDEITGRSLPIDEIREIAKEISEQMPKGGKEK